jgi:hypothetical protein
MFTITIPSADQSKTYTLRKVEGVWTCDCPDHLHRSHGKAYVCKHIADLVVSLGFVVSAPKSKKAEEVLAA